MLLDNKEGIWLAYLGLDSPNDLSTLCAAVPSLISAFPWALMTRQDGGRGEWLASRMTDILNERFPDMPFTITTEQDVLLTGADFVRIATFQQGLLFSDFNEVWFFENPPTQGPPPETRLTSELSLTSGAVQPWEKRVIHYMKESDCLLGVGDGAGLNIATPSRQRAAVLIAACETYRSQWKD